MPSLPPAVADGQIILSAWGNAVRLVLLSGLGRFTRRGQILVSSAPLESVALNPPVLADSPALLRMTSDGDPSYLPVADLALGPDSVTARELAPGSVDPAALQPDAVTRPALADDAVGTVEVEDGVITAPKLSAAVRESIADVEDYARPSVPAALVPITRIDTRSLYMAGPGALPSAAATDDGDILIRIDTAEASDGLAVAYPADFDFGDTIDTLTGVSANAGRWYVVYGNRFVEAYAADGTRYRAGDFGVGTNNIAGVGLENTGSGWAVLEGQGSNRIRHYSYAGVSDGSFSVAAAGTRTAELALFNNRFYVLYASGSLLAWTVTGVRAADDDIVLDSENAAPSGLVAADGTLFVVDQEAEYVFAYGADGARVTALDFPVSYRERLRIAYSVMANKLGVFAVDGVRGYNPDGSRYVTDRGAYVDRVSARLYLSDGSAWTEVTSISGIHGGGGGGGGISLATAQAVAAAAARAVFTGALEAKLQGIETSATRDQTGAELVAAITAAIGASWQDAGVTLSQLSSAITTHDNGALDAVHVPLLEDHNMDANAHSGLVGMRGAATFTGLVAYSADLHRLTGTHVLQPGVAASQDTYYGFVPDSVGDDDSIVGLSLHVDAVQRPLVDVDGIPVAARQLRKGRLYLFYAAIFGLKWWIGEPLVLPSPVAEYPRYGVFSGESETLPSAAAFLGGAVWMAQQSYGAAIARMGSEYHWVADRRDDLGVIAFGSPLLAPNLINNQRRSRLDPDPIMINNVQYYAYRSRFRVGTGFINYDYQVVLRPA